MTTPNPQLTRATKLIGLAAAALLTLAGCDTPARSTPDRDADPSAEMVVDLMGEDLTDLFCDAYQLGRDAGESDREIYAAFADGYGPGGDPTAAEVYDELLGRC